MAKPAPLPWLVRLSIALHATCLALLLLHPAWCLGLLALVAGNHVILGAAGLWPRSQLLGRTVYRLPAAGRVVCLTFDDGPDPAVTPAVLDCLAAWGATASFFCIGARAQAHPTLVRRIAAAGHGVENHTLSHKTYFACLGLRSLHAEVAPVQSILAAITGRPPRWFRAPMGLRTPLLYPVLTRAGLVQATWRRRGYDTRCRDPATVLRRLLSGLAPGDVLLLHDGNAARTPDGTPVVLVVLPALLAALAERGLSAVALPDSAALPGAGAARAVDAENPASVAHAST